MTPYHLRLPLLYGVIALALVLAGVGQLRAHVRSAQLVVRSAHTAVRFSFPAGTRQLFPDYRLVALYGKPGTPVLGALGQQPLDASLRRAKALAGAYQPYMKEHAYPAVEIITTIASASPGSNGSYSVPINMATLRQWVTAARQQRVYVVLDLQPGREDFLTQARRYADVLAEPNVGLALDPEWRLKPRELPLEQIGSASIREVNLTAAWLAALTARDQLPQKLFLLHEFRESMLPGRDRLDTNHPELAYVIQMDGQGSQAQKLDTWKAIIASPPAHVQFGWKNFYQKDTSLRSPKATMQLTPRPWYVSYQ